MNSLGMKFVPVPGTDVLFCIHETRYKDYAAYAKETPELDYAWETQDELAKGFTPHPENLPVVLINRGEAMAFCRWLSQKEGKSYRLPTDREWSIAVGVGQFERWQDGTTPANVFKRKDIYPWGKQRPPPKGVGNYSDASRKAKLPDVAQIEVSGSIYEDGFPALAPVMSFAPNEHGLYDLGGNASEWMEDFYSDKDDSGRSHGVMRDGSYANHERWLCTSSSRQMLHHSGRKVSNGFRRVLVPGNTP